MSDYPPTSIETIRDYEQSEVVAGFCDWKADDVPPGPNRSDAFRWGWSNAARDHGHEDDGYDALRRQYARTYVLGKAA